MINPHTLYFGSHSRLTSSTCIQPVKGYVNSRTVPRSSHSFSSCSTASPILPYNFQHVKFLENFGVTLFTPTHLPLIHFSHYSHYSKAADPTWFNLILDISSFAIPPLTISLFFQRFTFNVLLSMASFHFKNLSLSPSIFSLIWTMSSQYNCSLSAPSLANSVATSTNENMANSTIACCIPSLTQNSYDNSESTLTLVFAPSYRLVTDLSKTYSIPFFFIVHSNTFLGTMSKAFSSSKKRIP